MNLKATGLAIAACAAFTAAAEPQISGVSAAQSSSRLVTVSYNLSEDAIVTMAVQTNAAPSGAAAQWVDIGPANYLNLGGDVNCLVEAGDNRVVTWKPNKSWPNMEVAAGNIRFVVSAWEKHSPPDYMVIDLDGSKTVRYYVSTNFFPDGGLANDIYRTDKLVMRKCPAAGVTWWMGAPTDEPGFEVTGQKETRHKVTLTHDFYIGIFELTQGQMAKVGYPYDYSKFRKNPDCRYTRPAENLYFAKVRGDAKGLGWPNEDLDIAHAVDDGCVLDKFRKASGGMRLDLPTEAQWEFACRAETPTGLNSGKELAAATDSAPNDANLNEVARYRYNAGNCAYWDMPDDCDTSIGTAKVGSYLPNDWGIYDMHGNIAEICLDYYQDDLGSAQVMDPVGPTTGSGYALRGGSYSTGKNAGLRSAARAQAITTGSPNYGVRFCLTLY